MITRGFYMIFIVILCLILSPVIVLVGLCTVIASGYPIIYSQKRIGRNGKPFTMYKFRTMIIGADKKQASLYSINEADGPVFKIRNDPRFTPVGKYFSHMGFDELPQFINVFKGEMSLIGPRPLPVAESAKLTQWQKKRYTINPGIISPWVLDGYHKKTFNEWMKSDIQYVKEKSLVKDIRLFIRSVVYICSLFLFIKR